MMRQHDLLRAAAARRAEATGNAVEADFHPLLAFAHAAEGGERQRRASVSAQQLDLAAVAIEHHRVVAIDFRLVPPRLIVAEVDDVADRLRRTEGIAAVDRRPAGGGFDRFHRGAAAAPGAAVGAGDRSSPGIVAGAEFSVG